MTTDGIVLQPNEIWVDKEPSPIFDHMEQPWSPSLYQIPRKAILVGTVVNRREFSKAEGRDTNVNNMVLKLPGSDKFFVPVVFTQFRKTIQQIIDYEFAINPTTIDYYAYLTIRQGWVRAGKTQSHPCIHVDG